MCCAACCGVPAGDTGRCVGLQAGLLARRQRSRPSLLRPVQWGVLGPAASDLPLSSGEIVEMRINDD